MVLCSHGQVDGFKEARLKLNMKWVQMRKKHFMFEKGFSKDRTRREVRCRQQTLCYAMWFFLTSKIVYNICVIGCLWIQKKKVKYCPGSQWLRAVDPNAKETERWQGNFEKLVKLIEGKLMTLDFHRLGFRGLKPHFPVPEATDVLSSQVNVTLTRIRALLCASSNSHHSPCISSFNLPNNPMK